MVTPRPLAKKNLVLALTVCAILWLVFPAASFAQLKPMSDKEMKSTRLDDFVRPLNRAIIDSPKIEETRDVERELQQVQTTVVAATEIYDAEAFYNDMKTQLDQINNGQAPVAGLFPFIHSEADKQHLLQK